jgi:hypothetical protein
MLRTILIANCNRLIKEPKINQSFNLPLKLKKITSPFLSTKISKKHYKIKTLTFTTTLKNLISINTSQDSLTSNPSQRKRISTNTSGKEKSKKQEKKLDGYSKPHVQDVSATSAKCTTPSLSAPSVTPGTINTVTSQKMRASVTHASSPKATSQNDHGSTNVNFVELKDSSPYPWINQTMPTFSVC